MRYNEVFAASPHAVGAARRGVRAALDTAHRCGLSERAGVAVSELVANAVEYSGGDTLSVEMVLDEGAVVIAVHDSSAAPPVVRNVDSASVGGRGLGLVASVADAWGYDPTPDGKRVWCRWDAAHVLPTIGTPQPPRP
jgi:anti-sigma regulatory factor (Ser/Thr protein kinase)